MKGRISFSKAAILALPLPERNGQVHYADPEQDNHYVRVTDTGVRRFVVKKNDPRRGLFSLTLGAAGTDALTSVQSRRLAVIALGLHAEGYTTEQIRLRLEQADGPVVPSDAFTLRQALDQYLTERKHKLKERTSADYRKIVEGHFSDWLDRPLQVIDESEIVKRFTAIKAPSMANLDFRVLRALYRYALSVRKDGKPVIERNPVDVLSQRRIWHENKQRRDVVGLTQLKPWWAAVKALGTVAESSREDDGTFSEGHTALNSDPETMRDFLHFLILTGLRRSEAANLRWDMVNLRARTFTLPTTKNREPHTLPLSDFLLEIIKRRHGDRDANDKVRAVFVFPGELGPIAEPKKLIAKVVAESGVPFSCHTLRRTFATIAESLDIPYAALKRLLNHKADDVTTLHYTVITAERLREPMEKITDYILKAAGERRSAEVVKLKGRRARA